MTLEVFLRGPTGAVQGSTTRFDKLTVTDRHLGVGRWALTLSDVEDARQLATDGWGVAIRRGGVTVMSGDVEDVDGEGGSDRLPAWTVSGWDDRELLAATLGWPKPASALAAQDVVADLRTGLAETVLKGYVSANAKTRMGRTWLTVAPDLERGRTVQARARMAPLLELADELGRAGGIGFTVTQGVAGSLVFDVYEPRDRRLDAQFSDALGNISRWHYHRRKPEVTRSIVGAGGEGVARMFRQRINTLAEASWPRHRAEAFTDRRDIDPTEPGAAVEVDQAGDEVLTDRGPRTSFTLEVVATAAVRVGDLVRAYPLPGLEIDDVVTETTLTYDAENGERVTAWVGPVDDEATRDAEQLARLQRRISRLERTP